MTIDTKVISVNQFECSGINEQGFSYSREATAFLTTYEDGKREINCLMKDGNKCKGKVLCPYIK